MVSVGVGSAAAGGSGNLCVQVKAPELPPASQDEAADSSVAE